MRSSPSCAATPTYGASHLCHLFVVHFAELTAALQIVGRTVPLAKADIVFNKHAQGRHRIPYYRFVAAIQDMAELRFPHMGTAGKRVCCPVAPPRRAPTVVCMWLRRRCAVAMKKLKQLVGKVDGPLSTRTTSSEDVELAEHTKRTATSLFRQFGAVGFGHSREAEPTSGGAQLPRVALAEAQLDAEARLIFNKYVHARDRRGVRMSLSRDCGFAAGVADTTLSTSR